MLKFKKIAQQFLLDFTIGFASELLIHLLFN